MIVRTHSSLRSFFSKLRIERTEFGKNASNKTMSVDPISVRVITSIGKDSLIFGIPNIVASVFGTAIMKVTQVNANMTHVRPVRRLFKLSFEAVTLTIAVIIRSSCFSMLSNSLSKVSSLLLNLRSLSSRGPL
jgi:hypothetical protein